MKRITYLLTSFLLVVALTCSSQSLTLKRADKEYNALRYASAIELYEQAIGQGAGSAGLYTRLADSYYKIRDTRNAAKYYEKASGVTLKEPDKFQYIQSLMQTGKVNEALELAKNSPGQSKRIDHIGNTDVNRILADASVNSTYFLDFNTPYADFSPRPYNNGLVFVSARRKGTLHKNVFAWNNTPFLNLYYVDTTGLKKRLYHYAAHREEFAQVTNPEMYAYGTVLHTDETPITSNDTRTAGYYGAYFRQRPDDTIYFKREVSKFNPPFNSRFHEGPMEFNKAQNQVIFTRNNYLHGRYKKSKDGINHLKLFTSEKVKVWSSRVQSLPFNSDQYSVAHPAWNETQTKLYFASDMPGGQGGSDLYSVTFADGVWGKPENLGSSVNTEGNESFPFVSGDVLYFSSDGHGGLGGLDVIAVNLKNLSQQKNIGFPINTNKDDFGLIVDGTGKAGFVSSNRNRNGLDDDIYAFERTKSVTFTKPIQVLVVERLTGKPIPQANVVPENSLEPCTTNDQGICVYEAEPGTRYTFSGKKEQFIDGHGYLDLKEEQDSAIVTIYLQPAGNTLYMRVADRATDEGLSEVRVTATNKITGDQFFSDATSADGELRKKLEDAKIGDKLSYTFRFEHAGYLTKVATFIYTIEKPGEIPVHQLMDIKMDKINLGMDIGKVIHINPIYFDLNKSSIRKDAAAELDKIVQVMQDNPNMVIELGSHTDCRSSAQYNLSLSEKRAKSSAQYVISKGIDKSRIYGKGFGETRLVNGCACEGNVKSDCPEIEHQLNRRTEFIILKM